MNSTVLTLGTFDGVHQGHQQILKEMTRIGSKNKLRTVALTFEIPPKYTKSKVPVLLTSLDEKLKLLKAFGVDHIHVLKFDPKTASTSPEEFFEKQIVRRWKAKQIVVGPRVAFGRNRRGKLPLLKKLGGIHQIKINVVKAIQAAGKKAVSSSQLRQWLAVGDVKRVSKALGYPFFAEGRVISGEGRGKTLGFPTANIGVSQQKLLPHGVFYVKVFPASSSLSLDHQQIALGEDGICNVGSKPTFNTDGTKQFFEVHLMEKQKSLYGKDLRVLFLERLRPEKRFKDSAALVVQLHKDRAKAFSIAKHSLYKTKSHDL